ncbi:Bis(5'-nucleosyl)-tetraphosphatase (symmetrical) [Marinomonas sp. MED121]|uniref:symmetrical bis(5'-nucleosyl)-tetraphosphatase n=1 Tax=Marinomonas sp. MED121 TaxID=314277 RepID=UPI000069031B|nr:symmetrical bis(5'-nucleosyl)-tetraphosphatase [Marinomonas sp. MED121]EAQ66514.1 Bis(5'-nucleosyl)-tetraphosphatase (symmetrical) [Marinomonas sp. MED121]
MATYAIGDIQGCLQPLLSLLKQISFDQRNDTLWIAGDLINRGPESLETLRFLYSIRDNLKVVLGNHDLHLLAIARGHSNLKRHDTLADILNAPDRDVLLDWLQAQPLCHHDPERKVVMTHAGIPPCWDLEQTLSYADEVNQLLTSGYANDFFKVMYGNKPNKWQADLIGFDRIRTIVNYLTRMRFCDKNGKLDLKSKEAENKSGNKDYKKWFKFPSKLPKDYQIVFGHWAALEGNVKKKRIHALDTGCVWGGSLTALCLDNWQTYSTQCPINRPLI